MLTSSTAEYAVLSELVIPAAHLVDKGNYTCVASNSIGRSTVVISLHVQPLLVLPASHSLSIPSQDKVYINLRVIKQTMGGVLLEWFTVGNTSEEKWTTLYVASDVSLRKEVVYIGPGINTYVMDDLLPGTKYKACVSLGDQPLHQGQCVVFVTGQDHSGLDERERFLHIMVVLCAVLLAVPVGTYVWVSQVPCSCMKWGFLCCPHHRKAPRYPQAAPQHRDPIVVCEDDLGHRDTEEGEGKGGEGDSG